MPSFAQAWGPAGHRMVAALAERELTPGARAEVRTLLAITHADELADVADWADGLRDDPRQRALWRKTSALHFVNFGDASCRYVALLDCPGGRCAVGAIERHAHVLADRTRPGDERAEALRFLVHFVADVHQPLHAGYRRDGGGNGYQVRFNGRGTHLHALWDTPVLQARGEGWRRHAARLARTPLPLAHGEAAQWAEESCRMTRDAGIYPRAHRLDETYLERMRPLAEQRVREAAARLAALLDRALARPR
ncbi:S1/P1 nuclease [Dokdonella sp.]|uniref:S1/P1 nuclease n=1 Tax=Dokdonella sp. TaxID=2291710 RepID=UPI0037852631